MKIGRRIQVSLKRLTPDSILILLILVAGSLLRLYRLWDIPFTHDEFSALIRTRYTTFHQLVEQGIMVDGHPAGVQVFLFYLTNLLGVSEITWKLPFILSGILSIWLVYRVGKLWFNATTGLLAASLIAFLQYPVMYSQEARPYASGLMLVLAMVLFWTRAVFTPGRRYIPNLVGFSIMASLCGYNHHFSMLMAVLVGFTGLAYIPKERRGSYLLAGLGAVLLYLPHLPILLHQLATGGIEGWLAKPRADFIVDYLQYVFQFSWWVYALCIILLLISLVVRSGNPVRFTRFHLIALLWFVLPYLAGFFYSLYRSSVLQYSVLIFSFPFLLFLLFGFFDDLGRGWKIVLVILAGSVIIPSLVIERKHYQVFYEGTYREILADTKRAFDSLGHGKCCLLMDTRKEINDYYLERLNCRELPVVYLSDLQGRQGFSEVVDTCGAEFLAFGCLSSTPPEYYPYILARFPFLVRHNRYFGSDFYLFAKRRSGEIKEEYFYTHVNGFEPGEVIKGSVDPAMLTDSVPLSGHWSWNNFRGLEFTPAYTGSLRDLMHSENDVIDVSADICIPADFKEAWLVASIMSDGRHIKWLSAPVTGFVGPGRQGRVYLSVRLSDVELRHHRLMFNAYLWNPVGSKFMMDDLIVHVRKGNPYLYGLFRKINDPG